MTSGGASVASARPASSCGHGPVAAGGPILTATTDSCRALGLGHAVARRSGDLTIHNHLDSKIVYTRCIFPGQLHYNFGANAGEKMK